MKNILNFLILFCSVFMVAQANYGLSMEQQNGFDALYLEEDVSGVSYPCNENQTYYLLCKVLKKYVTHDQQRHGVPLSTVDYNGIKDDADYWAFLKQLEHASIDNLDHDHFYALFINAYNALAIKMILTHPCARDVFGDCGPIKSIRDVGTIIPYKPVWGKKIGIVGGKEWTLDQIEDHLRSPPKSLGFNEDSRVHACIVCASISCPNVLKGAYEPETINEQMSANFNNFISNPKKGMKVNQEKKEVHLSAIFGWFEGDFTNYDTKMYGSSNGTVLGFISIFIDTSNPNYDWIQAHKDQEGVSIHHFGYDWDVNSNSGVPCHGTDRPCYPLWALLVTIGGVVLLTCIGGCACWIAKRRRRNANDEHQFSRLVNESDDEERFK